MLWNKFFKNSDLTVNPYQSSYFPLLSNFHFLIRLVTKVCQSCHFNLRNIGSIRNYLKKETAAQIIYAFVTSKLDYCNSLLSGLPKNSFFCLKKVQNTAVRIITRCKIQDNITPHLKTLHWLPLHLRIDYKIILLTFKAINELKLCSFYVFM